MTTKLHYEKQTVTDLQSALAACLKLREDDFWSFRGQRSASWHIGLHGIQSVNELDDYLRQFKRRCMEFPPPHHIEESNQWRWLFLAQHYRLKTRLLDWTKDPLVAIYFAVENILSCANDKSDFGAIWAMHVTPEHFKNADELPLLDPSNEWFMINPPPVTQRLARQSGLFTYHPGDNCLIPLDQIPRRPDERLIKIEIVAKTDRNPTEYIRQQLGILNIHHGSLFPDLEGIAQFVNHEWPIIAYKKYFNLQNREDG